MIIFSIVLFLIVSCSSVINQTSPLPLLLLISFDGFRWDYPELYNLTNFNSLIQRGVKAKYIENQFATVTFPLHTTIITGLYEETHGIIANTMYDSKLNATTTLETMNDTKWWSQNAYTQPIWVSNQLANDSKQRRSGVIAWPGVDTPINGYLPSRYESFNLTRPFDSILHRIIDWFNEPVETRINLGVIYYPEPDITGHHYGPFSNEMNETLKKCDNYLGQILQAIDQNTYLKTNLNVILTSDHGMQAIAKNHTIILEEYIDRSLFSAYGSRAFVNIFVHSEVDIDRIYANLSIIPNYDVYKKSQIPDEYHYKSNIRIGDLLFIGKVGYEIIPPGDNASVELLGDHGYDNRIDSMHPIFYGFGPAFRRNLLAEPFHTVDIYPLMSHILRLSERQTNGSLNNVKHILQRKNPFDDIFSDWGLITIVCVISSIITAIIYIISACRHARELLYIDQPIRYRLLSNTEVPDNNFLASESEEEIH